MSKNENLEESSEKESKLKDKVDWFFIFVALVVVGLGAIRDEKIISYWGFVTFAGATWFWFSLFAKVFYKGTMGVAAYLCGLQVLVFGLYAYSINSFKLVYFILGYSLFFPCFYLLVIYILRFAGLMKKSESNSSF